MLNSQGHAALSLIYDTVISPGRWRRALDGVAQAVDGKAIALRLRSAEAASKERNMLNSTYLEFSRSIPGMYYGLRYSRLQEGDWAFLSRQQLHLPVPDHAMPTSTDVLDARADYAYLRRKLGVSRRLGIRLNNDRVCFDAMSIAFDSQLPDIPTASANQIVHLLPHLTKSVELGRTFALLKARYQATMAALDHVQVGLAIALPTGEIIVANRQAKRIFEQEDGVRCDATGRVVFADPDQTAQFAHAVTEATDTARGDALTSESLIAAPRRSGSPSFLIDVAPLRDSSSEIETDLEGALITLIDPDQTPKLRIERFALLHGLTEAETAVCALMVQGLSTEQIAEIRDTVPVTAKNQIASIMQKAGISRRAELIRLVVRVLPPVA